MKAFLEGKKVWQIMGFSFHMFLMYTKVYKSKKSSILIEFRIQHQKYLYDNQNFREHFTTFFVRLLDHSH